MRYLVLLIAGLLLLLTACASFTGLVVKEPDNCLALEGKAKDNCYFEALKCSKMKDATFRDSCVTELAKLKKDAAVCSLIVTEDIKFGCLEQVAEINNDHTLCQRITGRYWEDNCHYHLAIQNNKDVYCSLIQSDSQRMDCFKTIALATNNSLLCEFLGEEEKEVCVYKVAVNLRIWSSVRNWRIPSMWMPAVIKLPRRAMK